MWEGARVNWWIFTILIFVCVRDAGNGGVCGEDWVGLVIEKQAIKIKILMKTHLQCLPCIRAQLWDLGKTQLQCLPCILGGGNVQHTLQSPALGHVCPETCSLHSVSCFALGTFPLPSPQTLHLSLFIWVAAFPSDLVFLCPSLEVFLHFLLLTSPVSLRNQLTSSSHMMPRSFPHQDLGTKMPV